LSVWSHKVFSTPFTVNKNTFVRFCSGQEDTVQCRNWISHFECFKTTVPTAKIVSFPTFRF
jgi:hypothetical protein